MGTPSTRSAKVPSSVVRRNTTAPYSGLHWPWCWLLERPQEHVVRSVRSLSLSLSLSFFLFLFLLYLLRSPSLSLSLSLYISLTTSKVESERGEVRWICASLLEVHHRQQTIKFHINICPFPLIQRVYDNGRKRKKQ